MMPSTPPNILWICTDQQRFDTLGCTGNSFVRTPQIDRLAGEGVLFEQAYSQSPLCTPSRGCMLTGRYPSTNRLRQNGQNCPPDLRPLPRILRDQAGYVCGLAGKLHLSACDNRLQLGSDWWKEDPKLFFRGIEPRIDDGYAVFHWDHAPSGTNPASAYTQWVWEKSGRRVETPDRADCPFVQHGMPPALHQTAFCAEKACTFMELMKDQPHPWLFSVNIFDPHPHFDPPDEYLDRYLSKLEAIPLPNYREGELDSKPAHQSRIFAKAKPNHNQLTAYDHSMIRAAYWAMVDQIDVQVGRILDTLERTGQAENTLVIFQSDHGELLGDHGIWPKGPFLYDCSLHVPLILRFPGRVASGRRAGGLVELTDLAPTILEAVGLPPDPGMQGRSLWPALAEPGPLNHWRDDVYAEYYNANPDHPAIYLNMLRTETHKIIPCHATGEGELYDLKADPGENHNLWDDPASEAIKNRLLARLSARMAFSADPLPPRVGIF